ncbi:hypothetical protein BH23THE1_BH23THE1_22860 [soil metagenome]
MKDHSERYDINEKIARNKAELEKSYQARSQTR